MENRENEQLNIDVLKKQRKLALYLVILCGLALLAVVFVFSLGWFAMNSDVEAGGMQITAQSNKIGVYYHIVTGETVSKESEEGYWELLDDELDLDFRPYILVPGTFCEFRIKIVNEGPGELDITAFGLDAPTGETEIKPITVKEKDYYLGTQLYIEHLEDTGNTGGVEYTYSDGTAKKYLTNSDGTADQILLFQKAMSNGIKLANGQSTVFRARITFENHYDPVNPFNAGDDQNVYKRFAAKGGVCKRRLYIEY